MRTTMTTIPRFSNLIALVFPSFYFYSAMSIRYNGRNVEGNPLLESLQFPPRVLAGLVILGRAPVRVSQRYLGKPAKKPLGTHPYLQAPGA